MSATRDEIERLRRDVASGADWTVVRRLLHLLIDHEDPGRQYARLSDRRPLTDDERAAIENDVQNVVYLECIGKLEALEIGGHLGNGHHVAQAAAMAAKDALAGRWRRDA